ncbi:hypothetical protein TNCV_3314561 [Trichonephila clavipes]|nr:hypothetical protein TNCV_3314561 [Trichonephila clavipes]
MPRNLRHGCSDMSQTKSACHPGFRNGINESTHFSTPSNRIQIPNILSLTCCHSRSQSHPEGGSLYIRLRSLSNRLEIDISQIFRPPPSRHFHNHLVPHLFPGDSKSALTTVRTRYWRKSPLAARNANTVEIVGDILKPGAGQQRRDEIVLERFRDVGGKLIIYNMHVRLSDHYEYPYLLVIQLTQQLVTNILFNRIKAQFFKKNSSNV